MTMLDIEMCITRAFLVAETGEWIHKVKFDFNDYSYRDMYVFRLYHPN